MYALTYRFQLSIQMMAFWRYKQFLQFIDLVVIIFEFLFSNFDSLS